MAQPFYFYSNNPFLNKRERELAARMRKEFNPTPEAMSSPFQNEFDRQANMIQYGGMNAAAIPNAVPGNPAGSGVGAASTRSVVPYGMTEEQYAAYGDDTTADRARAKEMRQMGARLMTQDTPTGRSVGPSGIFVQNPWEGVASGIEKGLGGYLYGRGRQQDEGLDARDAAARGAAKQKENYEAEQAAEQQAFERRVALRTLAQGDARLAQSAADAEGQNLRAGFEMVAIDPETGRPDFTNTRRAKPDLKSGGLVWMDGEGGQVDQSKWMERKGLTEGDFALIEEGKPPTKLLTEYTENQYLLGETTSLLDQYSTFTPDQIQELDKLWEEGGIQALETISPTAFGQRLRELNINDPVLRDWLMQGKLYSDAYRKSNYGLSQTGGETGNFANTDPFTDGITPGERNRRLRAHGNAYEGKINVFQNMFQQYKPTGEIDFSAGEELEDGRIRIPDGKGGYIIYRAPGT